MLSGLKSTLAVAFTARLSLVIYGLVQDATLQVKYTDIDYVVFTDAARFMYEGESPYRRSTYRYTPLIAWLLQPNIIIHPVFGKLVFVCLDLAAGCLIHKITKRIAAKTSTDLAVRSAQLWLLNPLTMTVTTRGNSESVVAFLILATLFLLVNEKDYNKKNYEMQVKNNYVWKRNRYLNLVIAAVLYGLSVHIRIYPVCYVLPIYLYLNWNERNTPTEQESIVSQHQDRILSDVTRRRHENSLMYVNNQTQKDYVITKSLAEVGTGQTLTSLKISLRSSIDLVLPTASSLLFGCVSFLSFSLITGAFYHLYGSEFLNETYLYHIGRRDIRHNFSPYFYFIYLSSSQSSDISALLSLITFLPQAILIAVIAFIYYRDIEFACFCQTFVFVMYNKVCTSQYFLWYLCLLPLAVPQLRISQGRASGLFLLWIIAQGIWLLPAYFVEFQSCNTFIYIWLAGLFFFLVNAYILYELITHFVPLQRDVKLLKSQ